MSPQEASGSGSLPDHVHAMMADDQAAILRLRVQLSVERSASRAAEARIAAVAALSATWKDDANEHLMTVGQHMAASLEILAEQLDSALSAGPDDVADDVAESATVRVEPQYWAVDLVCCGRDDGVQIMATWGEADAFRKSWVDFDGHERVAVIHRATQGTRLGYHERAPYLTADVVRGR